MTEPGLRFGRDYLQERILGEFPLARHIGVEVERADDAGVSATPTVLVAGAPVRADPHAITAAVRSANA